MDRREKRECLKTGRMTRLIKGMDRKEKELKRTVEMIMKRKING